MSRSDTDERYAPPKADLVRVSEPGEIPPRIATQIRNGWVVGVVSASMTALVAWFAVATQSPVAGIDATAFVDAGVALALSFGIYRKSRTCAVLMLGQFLLSKVVALVQTPTTAIVGLAVAMFFGWYFVQGVIGTFAYHRFMSRTR